MAAPASCKQMCTQLCFLVFSWTERQNVQLGNIVYKFSSVSVTLVMISIELIFFMYVSYDDFISRYVVNFNSKYFNYYQLFRNWKQNSVKDISLLCAH